MVGYTAEADPDKTAKAIGREIDISTKKSHEICGALRGMHVEEAKLYLEDVIEKRRPVPYKRFVGSIGHKRGKGFGAGGYPLNAAKAILKVLEDAQHNAEYKGLDAENMRIATITANRGRVTIGRMPRAHGRASPFDHESMNIEVILEELEE